MLILRGPPAPTPAAPTFVALLDAAAQRAPERAFLAERTATARGWSSIGYAAFAARTRRVASGLRALGAGPGRPVVILSGNGIDHALVTFGAMRAGAAVVPVSATVGRDWRNRYERLRRIDALVDPAVVYGRDVTYAPGSRAAFPQAAFLDQGGLSLFESREERPDAPIDGATVAKIMLTSGSTGDPKGVETTHGMMVAMLEAITVAWPFLIEHPPVVVDWLPWSHCFGGTKILGLVVRHAGTYYIDDGAPTPDRYETTVQNRAAVAPTLAFDVPLGWTMWAQRLRTDENLRRHWTSRLELACWGGATLPPATRGALHALSIPLAVGWGATETSPTATLARGADLPHDAIGLPIAGTEIKLLPLDDEGYEARVRGPQVAQRITGRDASAFFDADGFFRIGDVVRLLDPRDPARGLAFVARADERFKLTSGTWVRAGELRTAFLAAAGPVVADVLLVGAGTDRVSALVYPAADADPLAVRVAVDEAIVSARVGDGSAGRVARARILDEPPTAAERTAKGTLARASVAVVRADELRLLLAQDETIA